MFKKNIIQNKIIELWQKKIQTNNKCIYINNKKN